MKIVCRCEDITEEDIIKTIDEYGCETLAELKQLLRLGMGHCQGRTCLILAAKILARKTGKSLDEIMPSFRPPVIPVEIGLIGGKDGE
ncbi:MAG: (2Fe-2S)-binding protein [Thermoplasmata archaeon]|nr:MAG: (2Fe-2S)-binding protein [Thermoplasmata archaeon]